MKIVSTKDMRMLDQLAIQKYHIPSSQLMWQAAACLKTYIDETFKKTDRFAILCGPGNNGGDGFSLALQMVESGYEKVTILCNVASENMSKDEAYYAQLAKQQHVQILTTMDMQEITNFLQKQDIIVDALFGTGLSRAIEGYNAQLIDIVNNAHKFVLSVDMPSGIHSDYGTILQKAIQADVTITFESAKQGQMIYPGSAYCGKLQIRKIGIAKEIWKEVAYDSILNEELVSNMLAKREAHSHKGTYGKALLIGGSVSMHGAITLCAQSMLRSGVGTLTLFVPQDIFFILSMKIEEAMFLTAPCENGVFAMSAQALLREKIGNYDVLVIGNGIGREASAEALLVEVLKSELPCVIDGDAIFACANHLELLKKRKAPVILTPHPKEMSYLTGLAVGDIQRNPFHIAKTFASQYACVTLVLKDQYTLISDGASLYLNIAGNHALAKGGSGDVLCGIIAGLFAQGKDPLKAAGAGVYVHAKCADVLAIQEDANSILPSDLIKALSSVYKGLR